MVLLLTVLSAPASAYESVEQDFTFEMRGPDRDVFESIEWSLSVPEDLPVGLMFSIDSRGGADAGIEAASQVSWPDVLTHDLHGFTEGGFFELECDIPVSIDIFVDFDGLFTGTFPLWSDGLYMRDEVVFDGLLLPGGTPESVHVESQGIGIDTVELAIPVITGLQINFLMDIFPQAEATLRGVQIENTTGDQTGGFDGSIKSTEDELTMLAVPDEDPGILVMESTWRGRLEAGLDVIFQPSVEGCVFGACAEVFSIDVPFPLVDFDEPIDFEPVDYEHPLPAISVGLANHDFGDVEVGDDDNLPVAIENIGQLPLEGNAFIEGSSGGISVFPEYFFANTGQIDGVMVTFEPGVDASESAILVLQSNDPVRPRIEIPLLGKGFVPEPDPIGDSGLGDGASESIRSCGCDAGGVPATGGLVLILGLLGIRRRGA